MANIDKDQEHMAHHHMTVHTVQSMNPIEPEILTALRPKRRNKYCNNSINYSMMGMALHKEPLGTTHR